MLNVRVFVQSEGGDRSMIWQGARPETWPGQEDRAVQRWKWLGDTGHVGRHLEMRFSNGDDSGCAVEGKLVEARIAPEGAGHQVDVTFAQDKHRVW